MSEILDDMFALFGDKNNPSPMSTPTPTSNLTTAQRREGILNRIKGFICKDRMKQYGDAEDNFKHIADYWTLWLRQRGIIAEGKSIERLDVAKMMSLMKTARIAHDIHHQDSWDDDSGYTVIGAAMAEAERESNLGKPTEQANTQ